MKIKVTKTFDEEYWLVYEKQDVLEACRRAECIDDDEESCMEDIENSGDFECIECFFELCSMGIPPEYKRVK